MTFNSIDFLIFFPIVALIYFVLPRQIRAVWLLAASYAFYMHWNPKYLILILISTAITYAAALGLDYLKDRQHSGSLQRLLLAVGILSNLAILGYFKYVNMLIDTVNKIGRREISTLDIILPVGISFYTFQALGYMIDVYRDEIKVERNLIRYALFVSFFPQLVAGPIERSKNLLTQMREERSHILWDYERITSGLITMLYGFFVKVVIADRIAVLVNQVFDNYQMYGSSILVLGSICFSIQIYCDFLGYSTIAVGAARVLGFQLMENFNTPFLAHSITELWRRWHISMSSWFRDYVYFPLGGSRCKKGKHYCNILITFGVSGLWHGANWTFVIWGLLNGFYQIVERELAPLINRINLRCKTKVNSFGYKLFQVMITFGLFSFSFIFFRARSVSQAIAYIRRMFTVKDWWCLFDGSVYELGLDYKEIAILFVALLILLIVDCMRYKTGKVFAILLEEQWIVFRWVVIILLLLMTVIYGYYGPSYEATQFIYFQF